MSLNKKQLWSSSLNRRKLNTGNEVKELRIFFSDDAVARLWEKELNIPVWEIEWINGSEPKYIAEV